MATRPSMHARDSSGRKVSLLNDESAPRQEQRSVFRNPEHAPYASMIRTDSTSSGITTTASSPRTPDLLRSHSYDSQNTNDPASPVTPVFMADYDRQPSYGTPGFFKDAAPQYEQQERAAYDYPYPSNPQYHPQVQYAESRTSSYTEQSYDDDSYSNQNERGSKRYPCRFRDSHHCEKTFTTSGHASRHSKIHTAEKAVHCNFPGCQKKFTRADNMKQHLETHYKNNDKRSSTSKPVSRSTTLTTPAGVKKSTGRISRPPSRNLNPAEPSPYDPALFASPYATHSAAPSPMAQYGSLDMGGMSSALTSRPMAARTESGGLDMLANLASMHQS